MKRGQVALFVIIAILVVIAAGIVVYIQRENLGIKFMQNPATESVDAYVDDCFKRTSEDGIYLIGMQGGYIELPSRVFEANFSSISYGYLDGNKTFQSVSGMESQIEDYVSLMLPRCADFSKFDFSVSAGTVETLAEVKDDRVDVSASWPLSITKGDATYKLDKYNIRIPVRLGKIQAVASNIISNEVINSGQINLGYMIDIREREGMIVDIVPYNDTIVYSIKDPKSIMANETYTFFFADRF